MSQLVDNIILIIKEINRKNPDKNLKSCSKFIGFTEGGLYTSFKDDRMKIATLEKICDFYEDKANDDITDF
jgi:hypothetical protein